MQEKPKKSKRRISQWQFLLAWIGGQIGAFYGLGFLGVLGVVFLNLTGLTTDTLPAALAYGLVGTALGWASGWVQQWSIKKHFGHDIRGWRTVSAVLTGITFAILIPLVQWVAWNTGIINETMATYPYVIASTFMALFGIAGSGQAILLRKHIKHSWLFFLSTLVGGIVYGMSVFGAAAPWIAQLAQYSVTAFAILWLFGMGSTPEAMRSEDDALSRLSDGDGDWDEDMYPEDEQRQQGRLRWREFWGWLRPVFGW